MPKEQFPSPSSPEKPIARDPQAVREGIFLNQVNRHLLQVFEDALDAVGFSDDKVVAFMEKLSDLSSEEINSVLSLPLEIRTRRLTALKQQVDEGMSVPDAVSRLQRESIESGFKIGYHVSNHEILPKLDPKTKEMVWYVEGKEADHRDNDLTMAYYSLDLAHLYRYKKARYLYLIRAMTGPDTSHKRDNNTQWGRAGRLDVIDRIDLDKLLREVEDSYKKYQNGELPESVVNIVPQK
jgi:hypothetical protein